MTTDLSASFLEDLAACQRILDRLHAAEVPPEKAVEWAWLALDAEKKATALRCKLDEVAHENYRRDAWAAITTEHKRTLPIFCIMVKAAAFTQAAELACGDAIASGARSALDGRAACAFATMNVPVAGESGGEGNDVICVLVHARLVAEFDALPVSDGRWNIRRVTLDCTAEELQKALVDAGATSFGKWLGGQHRMIGFLHSHYRIDTSRVEACIKAHPTLFLGKDASEPTMYFEPSAINASGGFWILEDFPVQVWCAKDTGIDPT